MAAPTPDASSDDAPGAAIELPRTVAEHVMTEMRRDILKGRYALGARLDQQALADEFGASIIPVREALRKLEADGLVRIFPRRGAFVAELSSEELTDIHLMRKALESLALQQAIGQLDTLTIAELEAMGLVLARLARDDDSVDWEPLNREWHFKLYAASNSPLLLSVIAMLWDRSTLYRQVNAVRREHRAKSVREHTALLACCAAGDAEGAIKILHEHIDRAAAETLAAPAG
jgi:DNA-binding GntR family transcriptional regulator